VRLSSCFSPHSTCARRVEESCSFPALLLPSHHPSTHLLLARIVAVRRSIRAGGTAVRACQGQGQGHQQRCPAAAPHRGARLLACLRAGGAAVCVCVGSCWVRLGCSGATCFVANEPRETAITERAPPSCACTSALAAQTEAFTPSRQVNTLPTSVQRPSKGLPGCTNPRTPSHPLPPSGAIISPTQAAPQPAATTKQHPMQQLRAPPRQ